MGMLFGARFWLRDTGFICKLQPRRGGRAAETTCLESRCTPKGCRGFKSRPLRQARAGWGVSGPLNPKPALRGAHGFPERWGGGSGPGNVEAMTAEPPATQAGEPRQARKGATVSRTLRVIGDPLARAGRPGAPGGPFPDGSPARALDFFHCPG